jgi:hypothetical protein
LTGIFVNPFERGEIWKGEELETSRDGASDGCSGSEVRGYAAAFSTLPRGVGRFHAYEIGG